MINLKTEINKNFAELIAFETTKNNVQAIERCIGYISKKMAKFYIRRFDTKYPSLLISNKPFKEEPHFRLILSGHLDVIEGDTSQFTLQKKSGKLFGRGVFDMKGSIAIYLSVFKELASGLPYPIALQLTTDEEIGGKFGTDHQLSMGVTADFVIAGEPTNLNIGYETKGICWLKITTTGKSAHGSRPWMGVNAIGVMHELLDTLLKRYPIPEKESWQTTINIGVISTTNTTINKIPDQCEALIDCRIIPNDVNFIDDVSIITKKYHADLTILENERGCSVAKNNSDVVSLQDIIQKHCSNNKGLLIRQHGASDIRYFAKRGIPGVEFGLIGGGAHGDAEWIENESLMRYYDIIKEFMLKIK